MLFLQVLQFDWMILMLIFLLVFCFDINYKFCFKAIIPTNKPNAEHKRYSRPVNITPYCRPPRSKDRPHRLNFEWNGDKRAWAFTVYTYE